MQQCLGSYGHLFRVGGDEFVGILYAGYGRLDKIRIDLNETVDKWNKTHPMKLHMSCGCATVAEFPGKTIQ